MLHEDPTIPTVVHCSNGCGRTGVYICADSELKHFGSKSVADLHESVATARQARPAIVDSWLQYAYLHNVVVDAVLHEPSTPAKDVSKEAADFISNFSVHESTKQQFAAFDLGMPGRSIVRVGTFGLHSTKRARLNKSTSSTMTAVGDRMSVKVAICTDVVIVVRVVPGGALLLDAVFPRSSIAIIPSGTLGLRMKGDKEYVLQCVSTEERKLWMRYLSDLSGYTPPGQMRGRRMASVQPQFRREALNILAVQDPQTESGLIQLRAEYTSIPKAFKKEVCILIHASTDTLTVVPCIDF